MLQRLRPAHAGLLLLALAAACADAGSPTAAGPEPAAPTAELARLDCTVTVATGAMSCAGATPSAGGANRVLIGGGNGNYVYLQAGNKAYNPADSMYTMDVTVQNLLPQPMGTTDGTTLDPGGIKVLFYTEPYASQGDLNAELELVGVSRGMYMTGDQAYYQYNELLQPNATSAPLQWQIRKPPSVTGFRFIVYVLAHVEYPIGFVDVSPAADTMLEGGTQSLAATVRTAIGDTIPGATVTWGTSDATIASVDGSGNVTAVAPGLATITATAGSRSGQATIAVCPDLAVGEVYTATMPSAAGICFGGGASENAEYTYMPVNLSASSSLSLGVTGSGITAAAGPPTPALLPTGGPQLQSVSASRLAASDELHGAMLERDRRELTPLLGRADARVRPAARRTGGPRMVVTPGVPTVGDLWSLNTASGCSGTPIMRTGMVRSVGQHVIIVADTANPAGGFTTAQYDSIAAEFDTIAYPVDTANFGAPADLDSNGRVVAFYTRAVNELSPPASSSVVAGYFSSRDLFSAAPASCPLSNESEMFYMLVPDPTGTVNSNVRTVSSVRGGTVGTMGHELQHLINASRRIYVNEATEFEEVWLNEGLSHIAEELMFYRTAVGLAPRGNIQLSSLTTGPNASRRVAAFNTYSNQNFSRFRSWLQRPDTAGAFKTNDGLATRGAVWGFLRYAADRRNASDAALWFSLVNSQVAGKANLQAVLGGNPDPWLRDFTSAMYADDAVAGIAAEQQITSWNFRSVYGGLGGFPLGTRALTNGVTLTLSYSRGGGTAYTRFAVPTGGFASLTALSGGVVPTSPYALIVIRTK